MIKLKRRKWSQRIICGVGGNVVNDFVYRWGRDLLRWWGKHWWKYRSGDNFVVSIRIFEKTREAKTQGWSSSETGWMLGVSEGTTSGGNLKVGRTFQEQRRARYRNLEWFGTENQTESSWSGIKWGHHRVGIFWSRSAGNLGRRIIFSNMNSVTVWVIDDDRSLFWFRKKWKSLRKWMVGMKRKSRWLMCNHDGKLELKWHLKEKEKEIENQENHHKILNL